MICGPCAVAAELGLPHNGCEDIQAGLRPDAAGAGRWCDCQHMPGSAVARPVAARPVDTAVDATANALSLERALR